VEAIRTLYGPNLPQKLSLDNEIAVDQPAVEEAPFTIVTNKKSKGKNKVPPSTNLSTPSQNVPTPTPVVLRVLKGCKRELHTRTNKIIMC